MSSNNSHIGSTFESWLDETGLREEVTAAAIKSVIAEQIAVAMKERGLTKSRMAALMHTSRAQLDHLLDPTSGSVTLETLLSAAKAVGRELRIELHRAERDDDLRSRSDRGGRGLEPATVSPSRL